MEHLSFVDPHVHKIGYNVIVNDVAISPINNTIALACKDGEDGVIYIYSFFMNYWNQRPQQTRYGSSIHKNISCLCYTPDGKRLVSGSGSNGNNCSLAKQEI